MQCGASFGCYKTCVRSHRSGRCCVKQKRFDLNDIIMWRKKAGEKSLAAAAAEEAEAVAEQEPAAEED